MTTVHNLDHAREALGRAIHDRGRDLPRFDPLDISPYVAMSLLQKAIFLTQRMSVFGRRPPP